MPRSCIVSVRCCHNRTCHNRTMHDAPSTPVLIVGGGPVGLTLGHELSLHGVPFVLVERNETTTQAPKMDLTNSRSMELFSRLQLSERIRQIGCPVDSPFDVVWVTGLDGHEVHRFRYPSQTEVWERLFEVNDGTLPAEPPVRISQIVLEPALRDALVDKPEADVRYGWALESFTQDDDGVTATLRSTDGETDELRSAYLAGCDGGGSVVRRQLEIGLEGAMGARQSYMIHFRSGRLDRLQRFGVVWHTQSAAGTLIAQDDVDTWTLQARVPDGVDPADLDPEAFLRSFLGLGDAEPLDAEILLANAWTAHLVVADRYRQGRAFLCGDSAHQFIPTGGYGMNTGVGDAVDLGWKLGAVWNGWGGDRLLDSYEAERRPVALRNRDASGQHARVRVQIAKEYAAHPDLHDEGPAGDVARASLGAAIQAIGNTENECWGIEHGFRYSDSPVIPDAQPDLDFDPLVYRPSSEPGDRLPNVFLQDGWFHTEFLGRKRALYSYLGAGFSVVTVGDQELTNAAAAARTAGIPLTIVKINEDFSGVYHHRILLVRPDHHVAWAGDSAPDDWAPILAAVTGRPIG